MAKSEDQIAAENARTSDNIVMIIRDFVRYGCIFASIWVIMFYTYRSIVALSGKSTQADIVVEFVSFFKLQVLLPLTVAASTSVWALAERSLRKRMEARLVGARVDVKADPVTEEV